MINHKEIPRRISQKWTSLLNSRSRIHPTHSVTQRILSNRVPNIAPFGKGNDVHDHATLTHTLRNEKWACRSREMVPLRHYRMSLDVVARPLTSFSSSWEFVSAIADAMEGKTSLVESDRMTNFLLAQPINTPISSLVFFIVTSARAIS